MPVPGATGCPVEEVEVWYWDLVDEARHRRAGWRPDPPDAIRCTELELLAAAHAQADAAEAQRQKKQAALTTAMSRVRGKR
jgi:hypothetical protein